MNSVIRGELFAKLAGDLIVYCHTHDVNELFRRRTREQPAVLISHNSDGKVMLNGSQFPNADASNIPEWVRHWYAQNVNVSDSRITSLPIGLENSYIPNSDTKIAIIDQKNREDKKIRNLVYMNHEVSTNRGEREAPYRLLGHKPFVTQHQGRNGLDFARYADNIYNHHFVICPEGNGTDTHRTWETLYLNSIPIEKRNINNQFYTDLPICYVSSWEEVTENFLNSELKRIISLPTDRKKLLFSYWETRIQNHAKCLRS